MDSNKDQFKKFMQEETGEVPSNLDWDNMKEGILEKMQSIASEKELNVEKKPKRKIAFSIFLLAAFLMSLVLIPQTMNEKDDPMKSVTPTPSKANIKSDKNQNKKSTAVVASNDEPRTGNENAQNSSLIAQKNVEQIKSFQSDIRKPDGKVQRNSRFSNQLKGNENRKRSIDSQGLQNKSGQKVTSQLPIVAIPESKEKPEIYNYNKIPSIALSALSIKQENLLKGLSHTPAPTKVPSTSNKSSIYLTGGMSFWDAAFGSSAPERAEYETELFSYHFQASYVHSLKNNFFLMAGLNYQQLESIFEYETTIDDYRLTLNDTIIRLETNFLSGQQNVVRGDVELTVQADRRIKHYNTTQLVQLPLAAGKTWHKNRHRTDLFLGAAVNLWTQNKGRTLYNGQLLDYSGSSNEIISNEWSLHALLGARWTYQLSENLGLSTGFQMQKSLSNWSNKDNETMKPMIINWHVSTSYHF